MTTPNAEVEIPNDGTFGEPTEFDDMSVPRTFLTKTTITTDVQLWVAENDVAAQYILLGEKSFTVGVNGTEVETSIPFRFVKGKTVTPNAAVITCFVAAEKVTPGATTTVVIATNETAQTIVDDAVAVKLDTWTQSVDTTDSWDDTTGAFTARSSGQYAFDFTAQFAATAAAIGTIFSVQLFVGSTMVRQVVFVNPVAALARLRSLSVSASLDLAANDVVTPKVRLQGAGGNIALTGVPTATFFSARSL